MISLTAWLIAACVLVAAASGVGLILQFRAMIRRDRDPHKLALKR